MSGPLALVYPVLAQVFLTFVLMVWTGRLRTAAVRSRRVRLSAIALSGDAWPDDVKKISNNMHNQFETPVLFYVLCGVATYLAVTGMLMTALAWLYVITRVIHTAIHVTTNRVQHRFAVFVVGFLVLVAMWVVIVARLIMG
jgi:hypothetical protein